MEIKTPLSIGSDVDEGKTIFLRNVPFEISEASLKELIESKFGETIYVRIVTSKLTQLPKGVAFVKFKNLESVKNVLFCEKQADEYFTQNIAKFKRQGANREFRCSNTILIPPEIGIQFNCRRIYAYPALNKSQIANIEKEKRFNNRAIASERSMELIKMGLILPGMKEAEDLSDHDLKLRQNSWKELKIKMRNPNYELNKTRLCIRNIPNKMQPNELSNIILKEISNMSDLFVVDLVKNIISEFNEENSNLNCSYNIKEIVSRLEANVNSPKKCRSNLKRMIKRVKVIKEPDVKMKSRGFAFVNTCSFSLSKTLLKILNNNPYIFTPEKRPIVEFAIEDKRAIFFQKKRILRRKNKNMPNNIEYEKSIETNKKRKIGRSKRQRTKKLRSE